MVTFKLIEQNERTLTFWYYPEGEEDKQHGIIIVDRETEIIELTELAEKDWTRTISVDELNEMVDAINEMYEEEGTSERIERATEPELSIFYGDHAVSEIRKQLRKGIIPEKGMQIWY